MLVLRWEWKPAICLLTHDSLSTYCMLVTMPVTMPAASGMQRWTRHSLGAGFNKTVTMEKVFLGNSLAIQWLGLHASRAGTMGFIPSWGTKPPQAVWCGQKWINRWYVKERKIGWFTEMCQLKTWTIWSFLAIKFKVENYSRQFYFKNLKIRIPYWKRYIFREDVLMIHCKRQD